MNIRTPLLLLLAWLALASPTAGATPAAAPPAPPAGNPSAYGDDFVIGNVGFIVLHEFGHAVIREFKVPLLGLEEDSADTIAAITMLHLDKAQPRERAPLVELLAMAAVGNALIWKSGLEKGSAEMAVWSQHSLSIRRFARVTCLIYGSDTTRFQWLVDLTKMAEIRADWCEDEYSIAEQGVAWLARSYGSASKTPHGRISVKYVEPRTPAQQEARDFLQRTAVLEKVAAFVDTQFDFPKAFEVRVDRCTSPNAYWDPEQRELLFCYELVDTLRKASDKPEITTVGQAFDKRTD
jgi:hypothetical protein